MARFHCAATQDPGKNSFFGHDAVAGLVEDGASRVALLADLGNFQEGLPDLKAASNRQ